MTLRQVRKYGRFWQEKLKLQEWTISYRWMTKAESREQYNINGFVQWNEQHKDAVIALAKDGEDIRHTVVHEQIHLRIEGHQPCKGRTDIPQEVCINALAEAYVSLLELVARATIAERKVTESIANG